MLSVLENTLMYIYSKVLPGVHITFVPSADMVALLVLTVALWNLVPASSQGINTAQIADSGPFLLTKNCRFGKPTKGTCKCDDKKLPPENFICGSDMQVYESECEFQCALTCNPG